MCNRRDCISIHHNGVNCYILNNGFNIYKFKAKDSETNTEPVCLGDVSKDNPVYDMTKTGLYGYVYDFSFDCDIDDIYGIHKYLNKNHDLK